MEALFANELLTPQCVLPCPGFYLFISIDVWWSWERSRGDGLKDPVTDGNGEGGEVEEELLMLSFRWNDDDRQLLYH